MLNAQHQGGPPPPTTQLEGVIAEDFTSGPSTVKAKEETAKNNNTKNTNKKQTGNESNANPSARQQKRQSQRPGDERRRISGGDGFLGGPSNPMLTSTTSAATTASNSNKDNKKKLPIEMWPRIEHDLHQQSWLTQSFKNSDVEEEYIKSLMSPENIFMHCMAIMILNAGLALFAVWYYIDRMPLGPIQTVIAFMCILWVPVTYLVCHKRRFFFPRSISIMARAKYFFYSMSMVGTMSGGWLALSIELVRTSCIETAEEANDATNSYICRNHIYPHTIFLFTFMVLLRIDLRQAAPVIIAVILGLVLGTPLFRDEEHGTSAMTFGLNVSVNVVVAIMVVPLLRKLNREDRAKFKENIMANYHRQTTSEIRDQLDATLKSLLPQHTHNRLAASVPVLDLSGDATITIIEVFDFIQWTSTVLPVVAVQAVNALVTAFDVEAEKLDVKRLRSFGDKYIAGVGVEGQEVEEDINKPTGGAASPQDAGFLSPGTECGSTSTNQSASQRGGGNNVVAVVDLESFDASGKGTVGAEGNPMSMDIGGNGHDEDSKDDGDAASLYSETASVASQSASPNIPPPAAAAMAQGKSVSDPATTATAADVLRFTTKCHKLAKMLNEQLQDSPLNLRIGVHSGVAIAAVVGTRTISYDVFGGAMNGCVDLVRSVPGGSTYISETTYRAVDHEHQFMCDLVPDEYLVHVDMTVLNINLGTRQASRQHSPMNIRHGSISSSGANSSVGMAPSRQKLAQFGQPRTAGGKPPLVQLENSPPAPPLLNSLLSGGGSSGAANDGLRSGSPVGGAKSGGDAVNMIKALPSSAHKKLQVYNLRKVVSAFQAAHSRAEAQKKQQMASVQRKHATTHTVVTAGDPVGGNTSASHFSAQLVRPRAAVTADGVEVLEHSRFAITKRDSISSSVTQTSTAMGTPSLMSHSVQPHNQQQQQHPSPHQHTSSASTRKDSGSAVFTVASSPAVSPSPGSSFFKPHINANAAYSSISGSGTVSNVIVTSTGVGGGGGNAMPPILSPVSQNPSLARTASNTAATFSINESLSPKFSLASEVGDSNASMKLPQPMALTPQAQQPNRRHTSSPLGSIPELASTHNSRRESARTQSSGTFSGEPAVCAPAEAAKSNQPPIAPTGAVDGTTFNEGASSDAFLHYQLMHHSSSQFLAAPERSHTQGQQTQHSMIVSSGGVMLLPPEVAGSASATNFGPPRRSSDVIIDDDGQLIPQHPTRMNDGSARDDKRRDAASVSEDNDDVLTLKGENSAGVGSQDSERGALPSMLDGGACLPIGLNAREVSQDIPMSAGANDSAAVAPEHHHHTHQGVDHVPLSSVALSRVRHFSDHYHFDHSAGGLDDINKMIDDDLQEGRDEYGRQGGGPFADHQFNHHVGEGDENANEHFGSNPAAATGIADPDAPAELVWNVHQQAHHQQHFRNREFSIGTARNSSLGSYTASVDGGVVTSTSLATGGASSPKQQTGHFEGSGSPTERHQQQLPTVTFGGDAEDPAHNGVAQPRSGLISTLRNRLMATNIFSSRIVDENLDPIGHSESIVGATGNDYAHRVVKALRKRHVDGTRFAIPEVEASYQVFAAKMEKFDAFYVNSITALFIFAVFLCKIVESYVPHNSSKLNGADNSTPDYLGILAQLFVVLIAVMRLAARHRLPTVSPTAMMQPLGFTGAAPPPQLAAPTTRVIGKPKDKLRDNLFKSPPVTQPSSTNNPHASVQMPHHTGATEMRVVDAQGDDHAHQHPSPLPPPVLGNTTQQQGSLTNNNLGLPAPTPGGGFASGSGSLMVSFDTNDNNDGHLQHDGIADTTTTDDAHQHHFIVPRSELLVFALICGLFLVALSVSRDSITNLDLEYAYEFFIPLFSMSCGRWSWKVVIPLLFVGNVMPVVIASFIRNGHMFLSSYFVIALAFLASVIATYFRELHFRKFYINVATRAARLRGAEDELTVQRTLLQMVLPTELVSIVVRSLDTGGTASASSSLTSSPAAAAQKKDTVDFFMQYINDLCVVHIRLDGFTAHINKFLGRSPAEAIAEIENVMREYEEVLEDCQLLRKVQSLGDTLLIAGPFTMLRYYGVNNSESDTDDECADATEDDADENGDAVAAQHRNKLQVLAEKRRQTETSTISPRNPFSAAAKKMDDARSWRSGVGSDAASAAAVKSGSPRSGSPESGTAASIPGKSKKKFSRKATESTRKRRLRDKEEANLRTTVADAALILTKSANFSCPRTAIAVIGSAYAAVIKGHSRASFEVIGEVIRRSTALLHAAPPGFAGATESFIRVLGQLPEYHEAQQLRQQQQHASSMSNSNSNGANTNSSTAIRRDDGGTTTGSENLIEAIATFSDSTATNGGSASRQILLGSAAQRSSATTAGGVGGTTTGMYSSSHGISSSVGGAQRTSGTPTLFCPSPPASEQQHNAPTGSTQSAPTTATSSGDAKPNLLQSPNQLLFGGAPVINHLTAADSASTQATSCTSTGLGGTHNTVIIGGSNEKRAEELAWVPKFGDQSLQWRVRGAGVVSVFPLERLPGGGGSQWQGGASSTGSTNNNAFATMIGVTSAQQQIMSGFSGSGSAMASAEHTPEARQSSPRGGTSTHHSNYIAAFLANAPLTTPTSMAMQNARVESIEDA